MDVFVLPPWIPEDDLLLKNAVEAGASLESLAKGAVQFSRKYSIAELRDRWRSLLYDTDVSAQASVSMVNLELSGKSAKEGTIGDAHNGVGVVAAKRKRGPSIRKQYYAMRKRLCRQVFHSLDSFDEAVHDEMDLVKLKREGEVESGGIVTLDNDNNDKDMNNNSVANNLVGYGSYSGLEDVVLSHSMSDIPLWRTIEDVPAPAMPVEASPRRNDRHGEEARATMLPPSHGSKGKCAVDVSNALASMSGEEQRRLSDPLSNLSNEDEPCYENVDSLLLSSPCEIQGNDASDICESQKVDMMTKAGEMPSNSSTAGLVVVAKPLDYSRGDVPYDCDPCNNAVSSVSVRTPHREPSGECEFCFLNAEDADVPSEDSADSSIIVPCLLTRKPQPIVKDAGYTDSSVNNQMKKELDRSLKKENNSHSSMSSQRQIVKAVLVPNINSTQPPVGVVTRAENPGRNLISAVPSQSNSVSINASHKRLVHAAILTAMDGHPKQKESVASASAKHHADSRAGQQKDLPESEVKSLFLNQERENDDDDDNDEDDSDNEIPSFSDIEAMILEMDLCPTDQDTSASREVLRYQHAETKKTIMRLEQSAQSFMQRAIASRGAFAVLYGRNLKQYINKSEVILGRGTDDLHVDIDLRREGCANKISRRQALIRMEANGSFIIKNLGKNSIFLNGKEVAPGQLRGLSASCLIEIRGMSFIFETNNKSVKTYLENMNCKGEDKGKALTMVA
ncbi:hypothetical protein HN51_061705 [Arachis hypogaea]|uniref:FHA domain-containing protein n=1 Tax=Arachis hypogaea TaxID=3818 RepID=A0A445APG0_ARAHY|nr:uncharacterized protein LOC107625285 [Arachis ipaensis]XP_025627001.1 uncharacterized protein LOC112720318 [Arachis hypogaea]QHO19030.1 Microspherule protein [Arachis hypogaea]RYR28322.1 hypothetical protein Ahy_B01g052437 [Arachis hypogaea]